MKRLIFNIIGTAIFIRVMAVLLIGRPTLYDFFGDWVVAAIATNMLALLISSAIYIPPYCKKRRSEKGE